MKILLLEQNLLLPLNVNTYCDAKSTSDVDQDSFENSKVCREEFYFGNDPQGYKLSCCGNFGLES